MIFQVLFFIFGYLPFMIVFVPAQFVITRLGLDWNWIPRKFHWFDTFLGMHVNVIGTPSTNHGRRAVGLQPHLVDRHHRRRFEGRRHLRRQVGGQERSLSASWRRCNARSMSTTEAFRCASRVAGNGPSHGLGRRGAAVAEGQSDIGTHVLPFRSALIGAAQHAMQEAGRRR